MNKISVIVPCYNEEESLPLFYNETSKVLMSIEGTDYEILFVDDGSSDRTLKMIKDRSEERFSRNAVTAASDM